MNNRCRGFTLVELILVIVITGILAATVAVFFRPAVDSYFDTRRRAELTDAADTALRRMSREVRRAVPNSVRLANSQCFEFALIKTGGMFRQAMDGVTAGSAALDVTEATSQFDVLSQLATSPDAGDLVVVGNQDPAEVYAQTNVGVISTWVTPPPVGGTAVGTGRITLAAAKQFPPGYTGGRFYVLDKDEPSIFYICRGAGESGGNGTGELLRLTRNLTAGAAASCPSGGVRLASKVAHCTFTYDPNQGATQQSGFVWMRVELLEAGERVSLVYGAHVSNVP